MNYKLITFILGLMLFSCKSEENKNSLNSTKELKVKSDSVSAYNELANPQNRKTFTISEYNTDNPEIQNIDRPEKTVIGNLQIDTSQAFGIWTQDPSGPHADFWLTAKSFYVVDYDGDGAMPYILEENKITIFYNDFIQKGTITSTSQDILKIKWSDMDRETEYVRFEN
ncbi:hypothetical protein LB467_18305 [Salegentibacter sp. JZCK2]|uniref:hypothetical protein n=1 Tax=Salegentibacter tibetensis TaxID=2873600 RepID=UPI001CCF8CA5|nr:hypothetical protein [Salegentibacter tibetensis]MBZ9731643.1 hypothetical protein [Salegentibacter tibetensis]